MTYEEYKALPKLVKIIDVEGYTDKRKEMLGGIFEIHTEYHYDKTLFVWDKDRSNYRTFKENQVQRMTPVKFNGEYIGIGDKFISSFSGFEYTVTEYFYDESGIKISTLDGNKVRRSFYINQIESHTPLYHKNKIELTNEQLVEELEKRGLLENGKILKV